MKEKRIGIHDLLYPRDPNFNYSINEQAEKIVGNREQVHGIIFDQPCELDFHCPVCKYNPHFY